MWFKKLNYLILELVSLVVLTPEEIFPVVSFSFSIDPAMIKPLGQATERYVSFILNLHVCPE